MVNWILVQANLVVNGLAGQDLGPRVATTGPARQAWAT
jgi:hypothetical protein